MVDLLQRLSVDAAFSRRELLRLVGLGVGAWLGGKLLPGDARWCVAAEPAKAAPALSVASYNFRVEHKQVAPAGKPVTAALVNGGMPGPEIRVKEGDLLRVTVQNAMNEPTSIHWHGLLLPATMDGVPGISQDPILPGQVFLYEYPIRQAGTYWYHSHYKLQEQIGCSGPFIIEARNEPLEYDHDFVVLITDWLNSDPYQIVPGLHKEGESMGGMKMKDGGGEIKTGGESALAAGKTMGGMQTGGGADLTDVKYDAFLLNGKSSTDPWTCKARPGERIRFRVINAGASTFFRFMIDGHSLLITHADGEAVEPVEVDNMLIGMAECYDAIVTVSASGSYTIRAEAQDGSGAAIGVLRTPDVRPVPSKEMSKWGPRQLRYTQLRAVMPTTLSDGPINTFRLTLGGDMAKYIWNINGQYYPKADPLLIKGGERVRVEMVNNTGMFHPMHIHGHFFRLLTRAGEDPLAPLKHTVTVAPKETVKFEFIANNPGKWFFHCHNLYHLETGMAREWHYMI